MEDLTTAIVMFGYTVVFSVIGLIIYSMFSKNKRSKQYGIYCNSSLVYEIKFNSTTHRYISTWVDRYNNNS